MGKSNLFDHYEGISRALSEYSSILDRFNSENYSRLLESVSRNSSLSDTLEEISVRQRALLDRLESPLLKYAETMDIVSLQWDALAKIATSFKTPEIEKLQKTLIRNNFSGLLEFTNALQTSYIEAPNIALLKTAKIFEHIDIDLPKGLPSIIKSLNVDTANRLAYSENISLDVPSRMFYLEEYPDERVNVEETNIICSSLHLLSGLDEADLIVFLNYLEQHPNLALNNPTGRRILQIISQWSEMIDFDQPYYYHARALGENDCPYTEAQLRRAPIGVTWHGRFNFVGQSHYYFSDVPKGAIMEVSKHTKEPRVQIAKLRPTRSIRMIDLSQELKTKNKFLDYCRFGTTNTNLHIQREYLLPCFVADCCRESGIEGIKYYGSKEYKNYVSWDDSYFKFEGSEIQTIK